MPQNENESRALLSDEDRLQNAVDLLIQELRANRDGAEEVAALKLLLKQLRTANQHLVLATVKAQVLQEQAEERNRQQDEFLAMLAHELRNPMAPISNAAKLLESVIDAHPMLPQIQGIISRQVDHLTRLLDDLLDASRLTTGRVTLQKTVTQLNDILAHAIEVSRPHIEKRRQQLDIRLSKPVMINGDAVRLSQVFLNLLINASKFTPLNGRIELSTERQAGSVVVTVKDNGCGIDPELQTRIFDLFIQGPRQLDRSEGGLGIGLSVAKAITELHGGQITVNSGGAGFGSEFLVRLPLVSSETREPPPVVLPLAPASPARRILLIEDNADTAMTLKMILELDGHHVATAFDGPTGLAMAKTDRYDVIICDIGLPGMDGFEVVKQLRQQPAKSETLVIALSGYCQAQDRNRGFDAGFDQYLVKPVSGSALLNAIAAHAGVS